MAKIFSYISGRVFATVLSAEIAPDVTCMQVAFNMTRVYVASDVVRIEIAPTEAPTTTKRSSSSDTKQVILTETIR